MPADVTCAHFHVFTISVVFVFFTHSGTIHICKRYSVGNKKDQFLLSDIYVEDLINIVLTENFRLALQVIRNLLKGLLIHMIYNRIIVIGRLCFRVKSTPLKCPKFHSFLCYASFLCNHLFMYLFICTYLV